MKFLWLCYDILKYFPLAIIPILFIGSISFVFTRRFTLLTRILLSVGLMIILVMLFSFCLMVYMVLMFRRQDKPPWGGCPQQNDHSGFLPGDLSPEAAWSFPGYFLELCSTALRKKTPTRHSRCLCQLLLNIPYSH